MVCQSLESFLSFWIFLIYPSLLCNPRAVVCFWKSFGLGNPLGGGYAVLKDVWLCPLDASSSPSLDGTTHIIFRYCHMSLRGEVANLANTNRDCLVKIEFN